MSKRRASGTPPKQAELNGTHAAGHATPPDARTTPPNGHPATPPEQTPERSTETPQAHAAATTNGSVHAGSVPGSTAQADPQRAGLDARQRGWYWHWNGIVTQYAPLIGLKGVGLLNSYTVWTDRRDQSPTRGYAFPSQQSEADFYGEDRAELITINKILVALDLIEIRKEMVQRTDPKGRKWKVPRNLYRVKDRPDGIELRTADVLRVAELANRDAAVFRYIKRIFSSRFAPIDRDNGWHRILAEVADDPIWQALTDKTAKIEARASARTRAGHKAREKQIQTSVAEQTEHTADSVRGDEHNQSPETDNAISSLTDGQSIAPTLHTTEQSASDLSGNETSVANTNDGSHPQTNDVAGSNTGLGADVDDINTGSGSGDNGSAEATNNGRASVVAPSNATYHQELSTTTTTTTAAERDDRHCETQLAQPLVNETSGAHPAPPTPVGPNETDRVADAGPSGLDDRGAALPADDRSEAERESLATAERSLADPGAGGPLVDPSPLVVSLFEAANDRRATPLERMLLAELECDADAPARASSQSGADWVASALREAVSSGSAFVAPKRIREIINRWAAAGNRPLVERPAPVVGPQPLDTAEEPPRPVRLPRGRSAAKVWQEVLDDLVRVFDVSSHDRLFSNSQITGYNRGTVTVQVDAEARAKLAAEYRPLLARHLERRIGNAVTVELVAAVAEDAPVADAQQPLIEISATDAEQGRQLWRAVLSEIGPLVSADDLTRLRGALPLGQDADGRIVIGAPTSLAARLIDGRCRTAIQSALLRLLGDAATVQVAGSHEWSVKAERSGA